MDTAAAAYGLLAFLTLLAELGTGQSWYGLIGETVYNPFALKEFTTIALFAGTLLVTHMTVLGLALALLKWLLGRRWGSALLAYNFLFAGVAAWAILLLVRQMAMRYASDIPDLATLRSLAGGDLFRGLSYVRGQTVILLAASLAAGAAYLLPRLAMTFERRSSPPPTRKRILAAGCAAAVLLLFVSSRVPDVFDALERFAAPRLAYRWLNLATDFDRDGYGLFTSVPDTAPFDGRRHPFALDVPDDGIDQDGLAGDFHYSGAPAATAEPAFRGHRKHVVLIVLESTRADALGKSWRGVVVAPNLNALAAAGTASPEAYSNQTHTSASLKVLFGGSVEAVPGAGSVFRDFHRAGYRVGIFSTQPADWGGTASFMGLRADSDIFVDSTTLHSAGAIPIAAGQDILRAFDASLGRSDAWTRPNFVYLNFHSSHFPYEDPGTRQILPGRPIAESEISRGNRALVEGAYWNTVANADRLVGAVIGRLKRLHVYDDTLLVVVGDHGEELFDEGHLGHGLMLNAYVTRVPFIVSVPGFALPRPVGLSSLRSILLRGAGADVPMPPSGPVFQLLGTLDKPSMIGMAEAGGAMTALSLRDGRVFATAPPAAGRYAALAAGSALKQKADRLANLWARHRWEHYLALRPPAGATGRR